MGEALDRNDPDDDLRANEDFHNILYRAAGSPLLFSLIGTVWLKAGPTSNQLFDKPDAASVLNAAHTAVIKSLKTGDSAGVRRAIEQDIFVAGQFLRQRLRDRRDA